MSLNKTFVNKYRTINPPFGPVGYITYKRTYARQTNDGTEEWWQTVERCVNGLLEIGCPLSEERAEKLYDHVFNLRCIFSGRALWQLGTSTVERFGGDSLQNCWCVVCDDPIEPFCFAFDELMLGGGVGFNILPENVYALPPVEYSPRIERLNSNDVDFIVPDNREGWVALLRNVLERFFYNPLNFTYSTNCIRARGQSIKSFGGIASGSEELVKGINLITNILYDAHGRKLRPVECMDVMNIIGSIVVSGNVRRSAEMALGHCSDTEFINAKNWNQFTVPNWRRMSNNSVSANTMGELGPEFWEGYYGNGEAYGLVNLNTCRHYGRIIDGLDYRPDLRVQGLNPCGEVTLEDREACNLGEIFLPNVRSVAEFVEVAELMYYVCKAISRLPFIHEETNDVVQRNHRLGIGISGLMQSKFRYDVDTFNVVYQHLEELDRDCRDASIKLTTVKPSGTVSLLAGVTPGGHAAYAPYYIRRIQMSANDPLVDVCRKHGYFVEPLLLFDGTRNMDTMVVAFPVKTPEGTVCAADMSAVDQLEAQKWLQTYWADNSVSSTIYYQQDELPEIRHWLNENYQHLKSVSFLLHQGHGFKQAPLEEITSEQYDELIKKVTPIVNVYDEGEFELSGTECEGGACPIK